MFDYLRRLATTGVAYTAASVASKVLAVLLLPLYTSHLSTADYGQAELLFSTVVAASIIIRLGLIEALLRFFYLPDERGDEVVATGFAALFWAATIGALIALPFAHQIGELLSGEALDPGLVRIAIGGLWVLTLYEYMVTLFRLDERAKAYFAFTIGNVLLAIPLTVLLVVGFDEGAEGLLVGSYLAGLPFLLQRIWAERSRLSLRPDRDLLRRMIRFGLPTMPAEMSIYSLRVHRPDHHRPLDRARRARPLRPRLQVQPGDPGRGPRLPARLAAARLLDPRRRGGAAHLRGRRHRVHGALRVHRRRHVAGGALDRPAARRRPLLRCLRGDRPARPRRGALRDLPGPGRDPRPDRKDRATTSRSRSWRRSPT